MTQENTKTLRDLLYNADAEFGTIPFIRYSNKKDIVDVSFSEFRKRCDALGAFIREKISDKKIHIAITGTTSAPYLTGFFGTQVSGNTIVPLDAQLSVDDMCDCINRADVTVFMYDSRFAPIVPAIRQFCPQVTDIIQIDGEPADSSVHSLDKILEEYAGKAPTADIKPDDLAAIIYTSGTTGKSKGVMLAHECLLDNTFCEDNESKPGQVMLTVLPIHHVYCMGCDILLSIRYGATLAINDSLMHLAKNIALFKPHRILLVPMIIGVILQNIQAACKANPNVPPAMVAKQALGGNLIAIFSGGAYLSPTITEAFEKLGVKVAQGYGMTECSPRISTAREDIECDPKSVGRVVGGCQVRIVDGEIQAKSKSVMKGYYKNPEATAETLTEDGWLRTGDLGYEENGWLYITGRKKNLIILDNGENVSPEELENKFADNRLVKEVLVYAKDSVITAEIFPNSDYAAEAGISDIKAQLQKDIDAINLTVNSAKTIRNLVIRDTEFEKTTSKKIKRQLYY
ncbi:MAG: AMP-binding protein [Oscillospiraceae bacterium]